MPTRSFKIQIGEIFSFRALAGYMYHFRSLVLAQFFALRGHSCYLPFPRSTTDSPLSGSHSTRSHPGVSHYILGQSQPENKQSQTFSVAGHPGMSHTKSLCEEGLLFRQTIIGRWMHQIRLRRRSAFSTNPWSADASNSLCLSICENTTTHPRQQKSLYVRLYTRTTGATSVYADTYIIMHTPPEVYRQAGSRTDSNRTDPPSQWHTPPISFRESLMHHGIS